MDMKKILLFFAVLFAFSTAFAQGSVRDISTVNYYGVDFSRARVYGASESGDQFVTAFLRINELVIGEWRKYNPGLFLRKNIKISDISVTQAVNIEVDPGEVHILNRGYHLSEADIQAAVREYDLNEVNGVGLVILGDLLDKSAGVGSYIVVFFDIATRDVIYARLAAGKAGGMGLRNYWAGALHNVLKSWQY